MEIVRRIDSCVTKIALQSSRTFEVFIGRCFKTENEIGRYINHVLYHTCKLIRQINFARTRKTAGFLAKLANNNHTRLRSQCCFKLQKDICSALAKQTRNELKTISRSRNLLYIHDQKNKIDKQNYLILNLEISCSTEAAMQKCIILRSISRCLQHVGHLACSALYCHKGFLLGS